MSTRNSVFMPSSVFSPRMVMYQIATIQAAFYFCFVFGTTFVQIMLGWPIGISQFFEYSIYNFSTGKTLIICYWITMLVMAHFIFKTIERTRKCLDFVLTMTLIHLFFSWIFAGFPKTFSWWFVFVSGSAACTIIAERLCLKQAQGDIVLKNYRDKSMSEI